MNKTNLENIIKANPTLTKHGFSDGLDHKIGKYQGIDIKTNPLTGELLEEVNLCEEWLRKQKLTKILVTKGRPTTYGLKVHVEKESGRYIPAGCMITAVLYLGIPYERRSSTPDIWISISKKLS